MIIGYVTFYENCILNVLDLAVIHHCESDISTMYMYVFYGIHKYHSVLVIWANISSYDIILTSTVHALNANVY